LKILIAAMLVLLVFSPLTISTSAIFPDQKPNETENPRIIPPQREIRFFHLTAKGQANPTRPGIPQKAILEAYGMIYTPPIHTLKEKPKPESGYIKIKRLTVSIGRIKIAFQRGSGYLSEKYIFIHASTRNIFSPQTETAIRPLYAHIYLYGQRNGDEVQLKGVLLIHSARGFTIWRLTLTGELRITPAQPRPLTQLTHDNHAYA